MIVNLHVTQKIINENDSTSVIFTPSIVGMPMVTLQCPSIFITLPTVGDPFEIGADYSGDLVKSGTPVIETVVPEV